MLESQNVSKPSKVNRLEEKLSRGRVLSIFYTAGFPNRDDTVGVAKALQDAGADMLEIGIPFSDPIADGPTIQKSSHQALANGMTLSVLFQQLEELRNDVQIPVLLMGYLNPILKFGFEKFCERCRDVGIDGAIIPDLPLEEYKMEYEGLFRRNELHNVLLISPRSSVERIQQIDDLSTSFVYVVSSSSTTGAKSGFQDEQVNYFKRIDDMKLAAPKLIGFGISDSESFDLACEFASGAIVGSAFIDQLERDASPKGIKEFIQTIKRK